ncbi:helix-turn-helix domain-containing protein [Streptomyces mesophilus]|uniref:helix-turn-helix domain-containing protein n=1 Tax=Streptomyces mesophilus TaxID=1775132 RepID=UPI003319F967
MNDQALPASPFFTTRQAAAYLNRPVDTLRVWRHRRFGPPSFRQGRKVMYRIADLDTWIAECESGDSRSNSDLDPLQQDPESRKGRARPPYAA